MCNNQNDNNGINETLKVILMLQQNACPENCLDSCDRPMLGGGTNCLVCNTRPVMIYTCGGGNQPLNMPVSKDFTCNCLDATLPCECSNVFRIEKMEGNCATFRVLTVNPDENCCNSVPYLATNSFFTISLDCICIIRCLNDCYVDCVC